ncbi:PAQR family membrane homeostasis protein TrhA [Roseibium salinum]|uniref:Hemolysin III family protein n=1 Tax=Roseibium salinum TaxID=1604349 RepID=A0ABT3R2P3_9HYPH|nr:hemolysin III family protein [Roseibium sp. DSM 29163]MCX2723522.1 hemolysin III family protein [Roseibium sp. DSM 29163]MDN3718608.1 hemolysin III family protein [Roseibium salinum]
MPTTQTPRPQTLAEFVADGAVHMIGICLGLTATLVLAVTLWDAGDPARQVTVMIYAGCLMAMLICSALYNMFAREHRSGILRRLDHAAIFLMIAGTYTPLAAIMIGGWTGGILLAFVWTGAVAGAIIKLVHLTGLERLTVPIYLALGWVAVFAAKPLIEKATPFGFYMILAGGLLYTIGTLFYAWKRLPFQNAIWHAFVLAAAVCHFGAVFHDVALMQNV